MDVSRSTKSGHHGSEAAGKRESGRGDTAEEARTRSLRASETCMNKEDIILNMRVFSRGVMFLFEYPLCYVENGL